MKNGRRTVFIPAEVYKKVEERTRAAGFNSVDEYVTFVLGEVLKEEESQGAVVSEADEAEVKKRLRALGYFE